VGAELYHADEWIEIMKSIVAFRNFKNASKNNQSVNDFRYQRAGVTAFITLSFLCLSRSYKIYVLYIPWLWILLWEEHSKKLSWFLKGNFSPHGTQRISQKSEREYSIHRGWNITPTYWRDGIRGEIKNSEVRNICPKPVKSKWRQTSFGCRIYPRPRFRCFTPSNWDFSWHKSLTNSTEQSSSWQEQILSYSKIFP
jgi:hypothetical protein